MKKRIKDISGVTVLELIVALSIMVIFFMLLTWIVSVSGKVYVQEVRATIDRDALSTIIDDIEGYVLYGEDIDVVYYFTPTINTNYVVDNPDYDIDVDIDLSTYLESRHTHGWLYLRGKDVVCVRDDGSEELVLNLSDKNFVGNGLRMGYKDIYLTNTKEDGTGADIIHGLPYEPRYYQGMDLVFQVYDENGFNDAGIIDRPEIREGIYTLVVKGESKGINLSSELIEVVSSFNER